MQLFVNAPQGNTLVFNDLTSSTSVAHLKSLIAARAGFVAEESRLSFAGKALEDSANLSAYEIAADSTIDVNFRLVGGAKKRKKKTYTTPKKIKHKKKKVKLAVLKYYKVDDAGKITRLRRECPNAECGAGIFMAFHFDRQYCGKCGLTYVFKKEGETA